MKNIPSFEVNHIKLNPGIYVSRLDNVNGSILTTFDLRFTKPNVEPAMETAAIHAIEHLAATYLRNDEKWKQHVIYFGPMGCRTGFYLILAGEYQSLDIVELLISICNHILNFEGDIPGATMHGCGNYLDMNLMVCKYHVKRYLNNVLLNIGEENTVYPI